ncbi:MAG: dTDP-4-dehydrorhamnose reductase [Chitinophagaceae bacterium]
MTDGISQNITELEIWGGIECTINRVDDQYFDQLQFSDHYNRIEDIDLIAECGIKKIRYPILWEKHLPIKDAVLDWSWITDPLNKLKGYNIDVIAGLTHHGSGPAYTNMLDDDYPYLLAAYAKKVAAQFPWINYYTPVNEPLTTARFSGLYGLWYPHKKNDKSFLKMLLNELKATVLAMQEIRKINPKAKLIQTEDLAKTYSTPKLKYQAKFENERRWLTFDLLCGRVTKQHKLWKYLTKHVKEKDLMFFQEHHCPPDLIGFNHYLTSERYLDENLTKYPKHTHGGNKRHRYADVEVVRVKIDQPTGIEVLLGEAWSRFKMPIAITEVHLHCWREEQLRWFYHVYQSCKNVRQKGIDLRAITSWAMLGSYCWNKLLTQPNGEYEPGVFDLRNGTPRPTALASFIKKLTSQQTDVYPVSKTKGWWLREDRYLYPPVVSINRMAKNKKADQPIVIIGKNGTLGQAIARVCSERALEYELVSRETCDIANEQSIIALIEKVKPWTIINAAGYVRVDDAEAESKQCFRDNATGPQNLAIACKKAGIKLISYSSDLVFDGKKNMPYTILDDVNPLNVYGKSKAESEEKILSEDASSLIIRTSAFFGPWDQYNFVHWVIHSLENGTEIQVMNDVTISPTYVPDLANTTLDLLIDDEKGIWHLANAGAITWADFAMLIADHKGLDKSKIKAIPMETLHLPAKRPNYSVLQSSVLPKLENALTRYFEAKKELKRA